MHWQFERGGWRLLLLNVIAAGTEKAAKKLFDPKAPAAFVEVPYQAPSAVSEGLSKEVIMEGIYRVRSQVKACYDMALERERSAGKVAVSFVIGPTGNVLSSEVAENSTGDDEFGACVAERIRRLTFPPPRGGGNVKVTYPWIFKTAGED